MTRWAWSFFVEANTDTLDPMSRIMPTIGTHWSKRRSGQMPRSPHTRSRRSSAPRTEEEFSGRSMACILLGPAGLR